MSSPSFEVLFFGNDMVLEVRKLRNELTGAFLNSATVDVTLNDSTGTGVLGQTWPRSLAYVAGSDGIYRTTIPDTLTLTANAKYTAVITADAGAGLAARWDVPIICKRRT